MSTHSTRRSASNKNGSSVSEFFTWLGGADAELVRNHPEELMRLSAIGATILFTGIFAALSSGYAFFSVFGWTPWVPILAVVWSGMIVNMDRLIVMTIRGSFWRKVGSAIPRFFLAAIIAVVVARPLELWIFAPEVNREMAQEELRVRNGATDRLQIAEQSAREAFMRGVDGERGALGIDRLQAAVDSAAKRVAECRTEQNRMYEEWSREIDEGAGGRRSGPGPASNEKLRMYHGKRDECLGMTRRADLAQQSVDATERQLAVSIKGLEGTRDSALVRATREFERDTATLGRTRAESLLAREQALTRLASRDPGVKRMVTVITLLFLLVEILPMIAKIMAGSTIYDATLSQRERTTMAILGGASAVETELEEAGKFSAGLHAQLLRQRTVFRRRALALQRIAVREVLDEARARWKPPTTIVEAMTEAMTQAAHEAVKGNSEPAAGGTLKREDPVRHRFSLSAAQVRQHLAGIWGVTLVFFAGALVVVVSYKILGGVEPFSKTDFTIALTIGGIVITLLIPILSSASGHPFSSDAGGRRE